MIELCGINHFSIDRPVGSAYPPSIIRGWSRGFLARRTKEHAPEVVMTGQLGIAMRIGVCLMALCSWCALQTKVASAQNSRGTLVGHVQDSSGGAISGAKVTARDADTGIVNVFTTASVGYFVFVDLVHRTYTV